MSKQNLEPLSVSELSTQIKSYLEATFVEVCFQGEISNFTLHQASGHLYFSVKDATSTIRCVMFKGNARSLTFTPKNGLHIIVRGAISVYLARGEYQVLCHSLQLGGVGSLAERYEKLKKQLESQGFFDPHKKKPLPAFPKKIALLTSLSGAALQDMKKVATSRWNLTKLIAFDTLTQGAQAAEQIARNIAYIDSFYDTQDAFDIIVIGRGGGSMEDLWAFNELCVANAIYKAKTPIVSAVGHEIDYVISDFVADMRAPTPSACMEMILPDRHEWLLRLDEIYANFTTLLEHKLTKANELCSHLLELYQHLSYENTLTLAGDQIQQQSVLLDSAFTQIMRQKRAALESTTLQYTTYPLLQEQKLTLQTLQNALQAAHPKRLVKDSFAQILREGKQTKLEELQAGDEIELCSTHSTATATILNTTTLAQEH